MFHVGREAGEAQVGQRVLRALFFQLITVVREDPSNGLADLDELSAFEELLD